MYGYAFLPSLHTSIYPSEQDLQTQPGFLGFLVSIFLIIQSHDLEICTLK